MPKKGDLGMYNVMLIEDEKMDRVEECRVQAEDLEQGTYFAQIAAQMQRYIQENYSKDISLQDAAKTMCYSEAYFSRLFKQCFHVNFTVYLTQYRIRIAKQLMLKQNISIKEIGARVGYTDNNYFTKVFRRSTGLNPSEYRTRLMGKLMEGKYVC